MAKKPVARATRPRAATPRPAPSAFYNPEASAATRSDVGIAPPIQPQPSMRAAAPTAGERAVEHQAEVARHSDLLDAGLTADRDVTDAAVSYVSDDLNAGPTREEIERIRSIRKPLGSYNLKLDLPKRRGYHRHWFNDTAGRVDEAEANGWTHVKGKDGKPIRRNVGRGVESGVMFGFAMEIPDVFWFEDQAHKHQVAQDRVDAIRQRPAVAKPGGSKKEDAGKFYNPHEENGDPVSITKVNPSPM